MGNLTMLENIRPARVNWISVRANQPFGVNFAVRHRVLTPVSNNKFFRWYHGLN